MLSERVLARVIATSVEGSGCCWRGGGGGWRGSGRGWRGGGERQEAAAGGVAPGRGPIRRVIRGAREGKDGLDASLGVNNSKGLLLISGNSDKKQSDGASRHEPTVEIEQSALDAINESDEEASGSHAYDFLDESDL